MHFARHPRLEFTMPNDCSICVYVVDDDASVRNSLRMLLLSAGIKAITFESAEAFLASDICKRNACVVADFKVPEIGGLTLQQRLRKKGVRIPVIFLTAFDSGEDREQAFSVGAAGFFRKPVDDQALLDSISWALSKGGQSTSE
jgi:FixJ family two-component response regulator